MKELLIKKVQLTDEIDYSYCPECLKKQRASGIEDSMLPKLIYIRNLQVWTDGNGIERKAIDDYWFCQRCKKKHTAEDLLDVWTCRYDGTKWSEPPKQPAEKRAI